ncbi:hypothetical protein CRG98_012575 [Punica granatum]|uniref:Uncharacterized protein n=1 Tax=Punica granatum TaxID=22663 RepID=A0A2I0KEV8_PUNGR|nr:hypothetical protein CRG98_012575 [Punica granatum]
MAVPIAPQVGTHPAEVSRYGIILGVDPQATGIHPAEVHRDLKRKVELQGSKCSPKQMRDLGRRVWVRAFCLRFTFFF